MYPTKLRHIYGIEYSSLNDKKYTPMVVGRLLENEQQAFYDHYVSKRGKLSLPNYGNHLGIVGCWVEKKIPNLQMVLALQPLERNVLSHLVMLEDTLNKTLYMIISSPC